MLSDHINIHLKQGVKIIACNTATGTIEAETRNGEVISVNAYHYSPTFRWPIPGEKWVVTEENGSWYLTGIYEQQVAAYEDWVEGTHYRVEAIVKYANHYYEKFEEKPEEDDSKKPTAGAPWQIYKLPKANPGDSVVSASSGRILQNNEGHITEVPNGLKVPFIRLASEVFSEAGVEAMAKSVNEIIRTLKIYHMMEEKSEVNPEAHFHVTTGEHLDALHGPGTAAAFADRADLSAAFPDAKANITERIHPEGFAVAEVIWTKGEERVAALRLHLDSERSHWDRLEVESAYQGQGFYQALIGRELASWWRKFGVKIMTADPESTRAQQVLALGGFHWQEFNGETVFGVRLDQRDRMDDYRNWLKAGSDPAQEPEWHQELRRPPKLL